MILEVGLGGAGGDREFIRGGRGAAWPPLAAWLHCLCLRLSAVVRPCVSLGAVLGLPLFCNYCLICKTWFGKKKEAAAPSSTAGGQAPFLAPK